MKIVTREKQKIINTQKNAMFIFPDSTAKKIARGIVCVLPGIFPAIIRVAPNSPRALAPESTVPATILGQDKGRTIVKKILSSETPRVRATSKSVLSICWNAARVVLYINGNDTTMAAITVANQENIIFIPIEYRKFPKGLFFPKNNSKKNPTTVGGRIIGSVIKESNIIFNL